MPYTRQPCRSIVLGWLPPLCHRWQPREAAGALMCQDRWCPHFCPEKLQFYSFLIKTYTWQSDSRFFDHTDRGRVVVFFCDGLGQSPFSIRWLPPLPPLASGTYRSPTTMKRHCVLVLCLEVAFFLGLAYGFSIPLAPSVACPPLQSQNGNYDGSGEVGTGPNWIERSFPVNKDEKVDPKKIEDYNLGISGVSYGTGDLSKRMYDAIQSKSSLQLATPEITRVFRIYAMDFTAKEAVRAALKQNGLEMAINDDEQDQGMWGDIDSIRLLDDNGNPLSEMYDSWEEAVDNWTPGQGFSFVARQVPAKMRELTLDELMQALDPKGELRAQAKDSGMYLPDEGIFSLQDMANENTRRVEMSPQEATDETRVYSGNAQKRGYLPVRASDLLVDSMNADGTESRQTLLHVMDALVSHGCLLVDLTDEGTSFVKAKAMAKLWKAAEMFFDADDAQLETVRGMQTIQEAGSQHAKVGFASYQEGNMQFLETRLGRDGGVVPEEALPLLGEDGSSVISDAFRIVAEVGKNVVRIATAASVMETELLEGSAASDAAILMANELLDDGQPLGYVSIDYEASPVSMSPLRLCRYKNNKSDPSGETSEIFGAHTDTTFVTAVPVAAVSGLEVFDEEAEKWYRPELFARRVWEAERQARGLDSNALEEEVDGESIPWYARYVVIMPGEFLQLVTRQEILAAVHRVVATRDGPYRLSAPVLLRCRSGTRMNVERYLGGFPDAGDEIEEGDAVLKEANGMTVEQIHDAMQPKPKA